MPTGPACRVLLTCKRGTISLEGTEHQVTNGTAEVVCSIPVGLQSAQPRTTCHQPADLFYPLCRLLWT